MNDNDRRVLAVELRTQAENLRVRPIPLMQCIPLLQRAADALDTHRAEVVERVRKPLTMQQINALPEASGWWPMSMNDRIMRLIRAVERIHGINP